MCCGTKRLVEIACPADCVYLTTARSHPPAVIQRQAEQDRAQLLPMLRGLSERQARLFLMFAALIARHPNEALQPLVDDDIAQAAEALAATFETSARGILYDHAVTSLPAQRLLTELKKMMAEVTKEGGTALERDGSIALRRIEATSRVYAKLKPGGHEFQELLVRMLLPDGTPAAEEPPTAPGSSLIIP